MKVRFWGVRGSTPAPIGGKEILNKMRKILNYASPKDIADEESIQHFINTLPYKLTGTYGGNTSCLELRSSNNDLFIIDGGTGLRNLGNHILAEGYGEGKGECNLFFTHTHWDHIQGIPFFVPLYIEGNKFHFHSIHADLERRLRYQFQPHFFPIALEQTASAKYFYQHDLNTDWELHGIRIRQIALRHPGVAYSFRFEENGKAFIFCTDAEFVIGEGEQPDVHKYINYFQGADVLVFDSQYTFADQLQKIDWGHSSALTATDIALQAQVKQLILYHHDPSYNDDKLEQIHSCALQYRDCFPKKNKSSLDIILAREELEIEL